MGLEARCIVRRGDLASEGKALLETTELIFSGDFRLRIPFRDISALEATDGVLRVDYAGEQAVFELGAKAAATWADKIRNPRGRLDKLGVKPTDRVAVLGVTDAGFLEELTARVESVSRDEAPADADIVFYEADEIDDLIRLAELRDTIAQKGAVWVVSPKGKGAHLRDVDVMAAAKDAGLVDTKVVSFSDTHTALKLVIPVAART